MDKNYSKRKVGKLCEFNRIFSRVTNGIASFQHVIGTIIENISSGLMHT